MKMDDLEKTERERGVDLLLNKPPSSSSPTSSSNWFFSMFADPRITIVKNNQEKLFRYWKAIDEAIKSLKLSIEARKLTCDKARDDSLRNLGHLIDWARDGLVLHVLKNERSKVKVVDMYKTLESIKLEILLSRLEEVAAMHFTLQIQEQTINESNKIFKPDQNNLKQQLPLPSSPSGSIALLSDDFYRTPQQLFESSHVYARVKKELVSSLHISHEADEMISNMLQTHVALLPHEERCAHLTSVLCAAAVRDEKEKEELSEFVENRIKKCRKIGLSIDEGGEGGKLEEAKNCLEILGIKTELTIYNGLIKSILRYTKVSGGSTQRQSDFEKIVVDSRTKTGQIFNNFINYFKQEVSSNTPSRMPYPSSLYAFSKYFSLRIIEEYNLGADLVDVLENYVENALFYRLGEYLKKYDYSIMNEKDKHWCKQQIWLRGVGMKQLGINEIYRGNDEKEEEGEEGEEDFISEATKPYFMSSFLFGELSKSSCPNEMLQVILGVIKVMIREASEMNGTDMKKTDGFDAETFFPILVYSLIHSSIDNIHFCLGYLYNFGNTTRTTSGEAAYYLCSLGAAVGWICEQSYFDEEKIEDWSPTKNKKEALLKEIDMIEEVKEISYDDGDHSKLKSEILDVDEHLAAGNIFVQKFLGKK